MPHRVDALDVTGAEAATARFISSDAGWAICQLFPFKQVHGYERVKPEAILKLRELR